MSDNNTSAIAGKVWSFCNSFRILFIVLLTLSGFLTPGQGFGQKKILLERTGRFKHYFYEINDPVRLKIADSSGLLRGKITWISDSSLIINGEYEVAIRAIDYVSKPRWGFLFLQEVFLKAGIPFLLISGINRAINHEYPVVDEFTVYVGGGLTLAGILIIPLTHRKIRPGKSGWQLKVLDFETFR
ncbi:MAG: hypothetical protein JXA03_09945 [Bacteroidales bacterium]|nr:hypothetical protein [Bacteroidales bacterium]